MHKDFKGLDHIHASEDEKKQTLRYIFNTKKQKRKPLRYVFGSVLVFCSCFAIYFVSKPNQQSPDNNKLLNLPVEKKAMAYVTMDINPSFELAVDNKQRVLNYKSYNTDAQTILDSINIKNQPINEAINLLLNNETYSSYFNNGFLEVSVYAQEKAMQDQLETSLNQYLNTHLTNDQYHCSQIDGETHAAANTHHTSAGKYRVIEEIIKYDASYSLETLKDKSILELYTLLENYNPNAIPQGCHSHMMGNGSFNQQHNRRNGHHNE